MKNELESLRGILGLAQDNRVGIVLRVSGGVCVVDLGGEVLSRRAGFSVTVGAEVIVTPNGEIVGVAGRSSQTVEV